METTRIEYQEYNLADENWEDDTLNKNIGDIDGSDPSKSGYAKGYKLDPYEIRNYAKKGEKLMSIRLLKKHAAAEVIDITYDANNYVNELLTFYHDSGCPLNDCFDQFTSNYKVNNDMKKQMCYILKQKGYNVKPTLVDETIRYADFGIDRVKDIQISDSSLDRMENILNGNANPITMPNVSYNGFGYDEISQTRSDIGVQPVIFEITSRLKCKKKL